MLFRPLLLVTGKGVRKITEMKGVLLVDLTVMATKYYQFDYAETKGAEILSLGSLCISTDAGLTKEILKGHARKHLCKPAATIMISNIARLTKDEFEQLSDQAK